MGTESWWASLVLGGLAVWRATHLLHAEAGPGDVFGRFRRRMATTAPGAVLGCFLCLSLWTAAPVAALVAPGWVTGLLYWLALSTIAIAIEEILNQGRLAIPTYEEPQRGDYDVVLREWSEDRAVDVDSATGLAPHEDGDLGQATNSADGVHRLAGAARRWASHRGAVSVRPSRGEHGGGRT
jgi:hypothetical protein